jgi:sulfide dehydrogenase [flavocytochrome c] flavoprotein subunit
MTYRSMNTPTRAMNTPTRATGWHRRDVLRAGAVGGLALSLGGLPLRRVGAADGARVVVVGGGPGGATAAKYLRVFDPNLRVTLVEPKPEYYSCFGANWHLAGIRPLSKTRQTFDSLRDKHGVEIVQDRVTGWDAEAGQADLAGGGRLAFDRLVVSPGIELAWDRVEGMGPDDAARVPHAWEGGEQYRILRSQLEAMDDGGLVVICAPPNPFRCPPGPYERIGLIAHYLKQAKPKSKVLALDPKDGFAKQGLFEQGWRELYGDMVEWVPGSQGGALYEVDPANRTVLTQQGFQEHKADVLNVIPPQRAGRIAQEMGLTDASGWCPVDQHTFASAKQANVHVIGDSAIAGAMPKSGHAANSQGKMVAAAIVNQLRGQPVPDAKLVNTCYSLVSPTYGISVAAVYRFHDGEITGVEGAGGLSPSDADQFVRIKEARYARGWYDAITDDIYG